MTSTEDALAHCLTAIEEGQGIEEVLAQYSAQREELEPLLRVALQLRTAHTLAPRSSYRREALPRFQRLLATHPHPARQPFAVRFLALFLTWTQPLRAHSILMPLLVVVVCFLGGINTLVASAHALPTEPLYPVKTAMERVQLALSRDDTTVIRLYLAFTNERLAEIERLIERNETAAIGATLDRYTAQVEAVQRLVDKTGRSPQETVELAALVTEGLATHQPQLVAIRSQVPTDAQPALDRAVRRWEQGQQEVKEVMEREEGGEPAPSGGGAGVPFVPPTPLGASIPLWPLLPGNGGGGSQSTPTPAPFPTRTTLAAATQAPAVATHLPTEAAPPAPPLPEVDPSASPQPTRGSTAPPSATPPSLPNHLPTEAATATASATSTVVMTPSPILTPIPTRRPPASPTARATRYPLPSRTPTRTPYPTVTPWPTWTETPTSTPEPTWLPTLTPVPVETATVGPTPPATETVEPAPTETAEPTPTPIETPEATPTPTATETVEPIPTSTLPVEATPSPIEGEATPTSPPGVP